MKFKKQLAAFLALLMVVVFTAGCSKAEWGLYGLMKEMGDLKQYESTGEIAVDVNTLSEMFAGGDEKTTAIIEKAKENLNKYSLTFEGKYDVETLKSTVKYYFKDRKTGDKKEVFAVHYDGKVAYLKVDELMNFIKMLGNDEEKKAIDETFKDVEYVSLSLEELEKIFNESGIDSTQTTQIMEMYCNPVKMQEYAKGWQKASEGFMKDVYDEYEMNIVKQDKNKYSISIDGVDMIKVIASFATYSLDNADKLGTYLKKNIANADEEQLAIAQLYGLDLKAMEPQIDTFIEDIKANKEEYKTTIKTMTDEIEKEEVQKVLKDIKIDYVVEKTKNNEYKSDLKEVIKVADPMTNTAIVDFSIQVNTTAKKIKSFEVPVPTEKVIPFSDVKEIIEAAVQPEPVKYTYLWIDLGNQSYLFENEEDEVEGQITVKEIEGSNYIPTKQMGEVLRETVSWDEENQKVYIQKGEEKIYLDAVVIDGTSYIKAREMEKLGYQVTWYAEENAIEILK